MKKIIILCFLVLWPSFVWAVEDGIRCFYSLEIPNDQGEKENFEFIVSIGDINNKKSACRILFDDTGYYNDPPSSAKTGCSKLIQTTDGQIIMEDYCRYYNCWDSGDINYQEFVRNGRYFVFHKGKQFFEQYHSNGGKCPTLYGSVDAGNDRYLLSDEMFEDFSEEYTAKKKIIVKDGVSTTHEGDSYEEPVTTRKCEYEIKYTDGYNFKCKTKIEIEKIERSSASSSYSVIFKTEKNDEIIEGYNFSGRGPEFRIPQGIHTFKINDETFSAMIDGDDCLANQNILVSVIDEEVRLILRPPHHEIQQDCKSLLGSVTTKGSPAFYLATIFSVLRYVAIAIIIVMTTLDFVGAVASQDNEMIKKAVNKLLKRAILCVAIFLLPTIIEFVLQFVHNRTITTCDIGK